MQSVALFSFFLLGSFLFVTFSSVTEASVLNSNEPDGDNEGPSRIDFLQFLEKLHDELEARREYMAAGVKRGMDMGMARGYSGSVAAKHLMGLAAANFAGGPGRRRRSTDFKN